MNKKLTFRGGLQNESLDIVESHRAFWGGY
jgi:hypothetical protein